MGESAMLFRGIVRKGVIVPAAGTVLPDGTSVDCQLSPLPFTEAEAEEFADWERTGDEAWAMIDEWEEGDRNEAR